MKNRVITISREFGSGGRTCALRAAHFFAPLFRAGKNCDKIDP